jgi:hypothetical protein
VHCWAAAAGSSARWAELAPCANSSSELDAAEATVGPGQAAFPPDLRTCGRCELPRRQSTP